MKLIFSCIFFPLLWHLVWNVNWQREEGYLGPGDLVFFRSNYELNWVMRALNEVRFIVQGEQSCRYKWLGRSINTCSMRALFWVLLTTAAFRFHWARNWTQDSKDTTRMPQGSKSDPLPEQTNCYKPEPYHTFDQVLLRWLSCLGCALHAVVGGGGVARALVAVFFADFGNGREPWR